MMSLPIEYRLMHADEESAILTLWSEVFGVPYTYEHARFMSDPDARDRTFVAVTADGTVLSSLHYLVSLRRDVDGTPRHVGEVDPVATRPGVQRQGHASRLLALALDALRHDGCDWSLLLPSATGRSLYERFGWRSFPARWWQGTILGDYPTVDPTYSVRQFDPAAETHGWERLAPIYDTYNRTRPLTVVRDTAYWRRFAAVRIDHRMREEGMQLFVAAHSAEPWRLCGYVMANFYDVGLLVADMAVLPGHTAAQPALLAAVADEAVRHNFPLGARLYLPYEPSIEATLADFFGETLHRGQDDGQIMARPIRPAFTDQHIDSIFAAPEAIYSYLDHF